MKLTKNYLKKLINEIIVNEQLLGGIGDSYKNMDLKQKKDKVNELLKLISDYMKRNKTQELLKNNSRVISNISFLLDVIAKEEKGLHFKNN